MRERHVGCLILTDMWMAGKIISLMMMTSLLVHPARQGRHGRHLCGAKKSERQLPKAGPGLKLGFYNLLYNTLQAL